MMAAETGIIGHLRAGGSRSADARQPKVPSVRGPTPISSFLRKRSSTRAKVPPVKAATPLKLMFKTPSLRSLGLKSPMRSSLGLTSSQSKFAWMDKSFLSTLRRVLEDSEAIGGAIKDAVSWNASGDAFTVRDKAVFATQVAPKYFNIMSVSTFRMVAQSWGFTLQVDPSTGSETYQHARFVRGDPSKCHGATMQQMKDSSAPLKHIESSDSSSMSPKQNPQQEDPLLLLAATASASTSTKSSSNEVSSTAIRNTFKAAEKTKTTSLKPQTVSANKPSVLRSSLCSVLSASAGRKSSLGFTLPSGSSLRRSIDPKLTTRSDASYSATLELLKSSRKSLDTVAVPPFSGLRMPSTRGSCYPRNPLAAMGVSKIGECSSLLQLKKRVLSQACLTASLQVVEDPISPTTPNRAFLENLRAILEHAEQDRFTHIVSWMKHGRSFRIYHENEFTQVVYPRLTNGSPLANVEDILKQYGFIKLSKGREKEAYFHPLFVRDLPMLGRGKTIQQWKFSGWKGDSTPEFFL